MSSAQLASPAQHRPNDLARAAAREFTGESLGVSRPRAPAPTAPSLTLSPRASFALLVSIAVSFLAGSSAPTPLYAVYQAAWGFSPITVTVVFGVYALAVLVALLTAGSLSDYVGRRPVLLVATAMQAITMIVFARAGGLTALIVARIIQGLSTGAAVGAVGAGLLDLDRTRGTIANAVGPMTGTALGGIVSGLMVQYLPAPTHFVYMALFAVFILQGSGVVLMAESSTARAGALASLRPRFHLPPAARAALWLAVPALVANWALAGFYGSLGPMLIRLITGTRSPVLGGLALFAIAASGVITVLLMRRQSARTLLTFGAAALFVGVGVTLLAIPMRSAVLFFAGASVAGMGFGTGFQGAIRSVVPLAAPHERAGVLSVLYVVSYLAMGLPAVAAGFRVVYGGGVLRAAREYGLAEMLLAALVLVGLVLRRPPRA